MVCLESDAFEQRIGCIRNEVMPDRAVDAENPSKLSGRT